jgi:hypothetical protein
MRDSGILPPSTSARSVYELHLIDPTTAERHHARAVEVIAEVLAGFSFGVVGGGSSVKLTLDVVDRRTGATVLTMREFHESARRLAEMVDADLDRLDAEQFAAEWGVETTRQPKP